MIAFIKKPAHKISVNNNIKFALWNIIIYRISILPNTALSVPSEMQKASDPSDTLCSDFLQL